MKKPPKPVDPKNKPRARSTRMRLLALEPRMLFDGVAVVDVHDAASVVIKSDVAQTLVDASHITADKSSVAAVTPADAQASAGSDRNIVNNLGLNEQSSRAQKWSPVIMGRDGAPREDSVAPGIVGDATHASLYTALNDAGTVTTTDDMLLFRVRVDGAAGASDFSGVATIGIDANLDGRIDLLVAVDGRAHTVQLLDPGSGASISPRTTSGAALPQGWLANDGIYQESAANYSVVAVSAASDPNWNGTTSISGDGRTDTFVTFGVPVSDIAIVLSKPSAVDGSGVFGARGAAGIQGFNEDTSIRFVASTGTQSGLLDGSVAGTGGNHDQSATFESSGAFTAPVTVRPATIAIDGPIGDGDLSASEAKAVTVSGSVTGIADGTAVSWTVSDGVHGAVTGTATVRNGAWSATGIDLSGLNDGNLQVTAAAGRASDSTSVTLDQTAPTLSIVAANASGTIIGTSDLPVGSVITVTVDASNGASAADLVTYKATVKSDGMWSVDTARAAPDSGKVPAGGFTAQATVTVAEKDAAGNSATATAIAANYATGTAYDLSGIDPSTEIVFIVGDVSDIDVLTAGINPGVRVVILDPAHSTIAQITETLAHSAKPTSVIYLVSHGSEAALQLGADQIDATNINEYAQQIAAWRPYLAQNAEMLLYACDVALGTDGEQFVTRLSQLTGAVVAASTNETGSAALGGDWTLEFSTGTVQATPFLSAESSSHYDDLLAAIGLSSTSTSVTDTAASDSFAAVTGTATSGQTTYSLASSTANTSVAGYNISSTQSYGTMYLNTTSGSFMYQADAAAVNARTTANAAVTQTFSISGNTLTAKAFQVKLAAGVDDTPIVTLTGGTSGTFTEMAGTDTGANALALGFSGSTDLVDVDSTAFTNAKITYASIAEGAEQLLINGATSGGTITLSAVAGTLTPVVLGGTTYAAVMSGTTTRTITFSLNGGGNLSTVQTETLLDALRYNDTSDNPTTGTRTFGMTVTSGTLTSTVDNYVVTVAAINDAPTLNSSSATLGAVNEDTAAPTGATVSSLFSSNFSDVDSGTFAGVAISS